MGKGCARRRAPDKQTDGSAQSTVRCDDGEREAGETKSQRENKRGDDVSFRCFGSGDDEPRWRRRNYPLRSIAGRITSHVGSHLVTVLKSPATARRESPAPFERRERLSRHRPFYKSMRRLSILDRMSRIRETIRTRRARVFARGFSGKRQGFSGDFSCIGTRQ